MSVSCEVDGNPAGVLGFVRVWTGRTADAHQVLEKYVGAQKDSSEVEYRDTKVGQVSGVEATWRTADSGRKRAFAVATPNVAALVTAGGGDDEEYQELLPV